jgi:hypothetical protein
MSDDLENTLANDLRKFLSGKEKILSESNDDSE